MFHAPFSFKGRIRRLEYGITFLMVGTYNFLSIYILQTDPSEMNVWVVLATMPVIYWFYYAQGAKRCHDMGLNGWFQLIPFFNIYMIFKEAQGPNKYGPVPVRNEEFPI